MRLIHLVTSSALAVLIAGATFHWVKVQKQHRSF